MIIKSKACLIFLFLKIDQKVFLWTIMWLLNRIRKKRMEWRHKDNTYNRVKDLQLLKLTLLTNITTFCPNSCDKKFSRYFLVGPNSRVGLPTYLAKLKIRSHVVQEAFADFLIWLMFFLFFDSNFDSLFCFLQLCSFWIYFLDTFSNSKFWLYWNSKKGIWNK